MSGPVEGGPVGGAPPAPGHRQAGRPRVGLQRQETYQGGEDLRRYPYALFRVPIDAGPVLLR